MIDKLIPAIILYLKVPEIGFVKTRLISSKITKKQAFELQVAMIKDSLLLLSNLSIDFQPIISFYPQKKLNLLKTLIESFKDSISNKFIKNIIYIPQLGDTNGQHFKTTFDQSLKLPNIGSCIIIGGDTPHINPSIIIEAVSYLQNNKNSAVIGPSQRGGFYIFGLNSFIENLDDIFQKENEFANLLRICSHKSYMTKISPYLFDIDTINDAENLLFILQPLFEYESRLEEKEKLSRPRFSFELLKIIFS